MTFFGHYHTRKRKLNKHKSSPNYLVTFIDKSIYVIALFAIAANIPQLLNIWIAKNTAGVSIISWVGFLIGSFFWLYYGVLHKETPIIFINFLLILVQGGIVLGLLIN